MPDTSIGRFDVFEGRKHGEQVVELEDEAHLAGAQIGALAVVHVLERDFVV